MFLDRILAVKREEVEYRRSRQALRELKARVKDAPPGRDFAGAVRRSGDRLASRPGTGRQAPVNLIAEIKKASPSRGLIRQDFQPAAIARSYERGGARAISVLTDEVFFQGHQDYLALARSATVLPVLRKDFIINDYQLYESRLLGADAILLIVAVLAPSQLEDYLGLAGDLGLCALVEVHDAAEVILATAGSRVPSGRGAAPGSRAQRAPGADTSLVLPAASGLASGLKECGEHGNGNGTRLPEQAEHDTGAPLIGINNRDLHSFKTDLNTTFDLFPLIPPGTAVVSESGIRTHEQVLRLGAAGVDAVLVGEALMEQDDIEAAVGELLGGGSASGTGAGGPG
jgi:indole-3-glycerol phosphate synthase